ncbi:MAG: ArsA family ATPase [Wenzhouxiangella sp.]|nr:MAG: ArsA family ATPase [Wenzhouxiangella sp.]
MEQLLQRRVIFCGGKGGVGKTTVAAALALLATQRGRRVRIVSTDPAHSLGDLLETRLDHRPRRVAAGFEAMEIDPEQAVQTYLDEVAGRLRDYVKPALYGEIDRQMAQARHAPGAMEAALLEQVARMISEPPDEVDLLIFDTAPTGHTLRLLSLPEAMAAWTDGLLGQQRHSEAVGRAFRGLLPGQADTAGDERRAKLARTLEGRRQCFLKARERLVDASHSGFVLVLVPERLPVTETARTLDSLVDFKVPIAGLVINQVLPDQAEGQFLAGRRQVQETHLADIERRFARWPRLHLPLQREDVRIGKGLEHLAALLESNPG